jgi:hypothetical protein
LCGETGEAYLERIVRHTKGEYHGVHEGEGEDEARAVSLAVVAVVAVVASAGGGRCLQSAVTFVDHPHVELFFACELTALFL